MAFLQRIEKRTYEVDHGDLDSFIAEVYPDACYNFCIDQEVDNDDYYEFEIVKRLLYPDELILLSEFQNGDCNFITHIVLTDLCNRGLIPDGMYVIKVGL